MSRAFPTLFLAGILSLPIATIAACSSSSGSEGGGSAGDLEVKLRRVEVKSASFEEMNLVVIVAATNRGGDVTVNGGTLTASMTGAGKEVGEDVDVTTDGIVDGVAHEGPAPSGTIAAGAEAELAIPVTIPLPADADALERLLAWRLAAVEIGGAIETSQGTIAISGSREISVPSMPKVIVKSAQIASVDEGSGGVAFFEIGIENPNPFEISVDRLAYKIDIGGKEMKPLDDGAGETVPPASISSFEETLTLNDTTWGVDVKKLLKQPAVPYRIEAVLSVRGINRPFAFDGEMAFAR